MGIILIVIRGVAQLGRALPWGGRGRGFESRRSDHFGSPAFTGNPRKGLFFCLWVRRFTPMIRTLPLVCSNCDNKFVPAEELYYRDNFMSNSIRDVHFICPDCIKRWKDKWRIKKAVFSEKDYVMTVSITLEDGTIYKNLDCTPLEETVVTSEEIPEEAQRRLFSIYTEWDSERKKNSLKDCTFKDEFMRTTFSCETYGGEKFNDIAFRFNMKGQIETETPVPEYVLKQIIDAYRLYEMQNKE